MLIPLGIIVAAGIGALVASYVLWWAAHRGGLWNLALGLILGLLLFAVALLIGYVMVASTGFSPRR